ncbi:cytochrome P450 family [Rhizoctonia solani]|uniref:Cytochrome P450 family n=1 Tax=Rhizoctonia solani TaxID=456999 RepID=A0A8H7H0V3_9AGAM|nr:cytochrome P450 family [Rhizoctonia solani]
MAPSRNLLYVALISLSTALLVDQYHRRRKTRLRLPPSPPSIPFFGSLFSVPPGPEYLSFKKLGEDLNSDIIYLPMFGRQFIILNSAEAVNELLEKRSAKYSDRSPAPMMSDPRLMGWSTNAGMIGYNDLWRHYRRLFNNWFNTRAVPQFHQTQESQARSLLRRLLGLSTEEHPFPQMRHEFFFTLASTMFQVGYGYQLKGLDDPFFENARQTIHNFTEAAMFTSKLKDNEDFFVNIFPMMIHIPDWFPGTGWKRTGHEWRRIKEKAMEEPFQWTKAQVAAGTAEHSIIGSLLQEHKLVSHLSEEERDHRLKELGLIMYSGGVDTTSNLLIGFVAAMVMNPEVQIKAQQEIDTVLGVAVLPTVQDVERLPYLMNLVKELKRWYPVVPTALPHTCYVDDNYRGYDIKKGSIMAITRDERHYKNPEVFNPDRFLDPNVPLAPVFGWGRRKCPGINLGDGSLSVAIASLVATYTFSKKRNPDGSEISPIIESDTNTTALELKPFEFHLEPRSEKHRQLILAGPE